MAALTAPTAPVSRPPWFSTFACTQVMQGERGTQHGGHMAWGGGMTAECSALPVTSFSPPSPSSCFPSSKPGQLISGRKQSLVSFVSLHELWRPWVWGGPFSRCLVLSWSCVHGDASGLPCEAWGDGPSLVFVLWGQ